MSKIDDGGPAFPVSGFTADASGAFNSEFVEFKGLSLRDYFAAKVMPTMFECWSNNGDGTKDMTFEFESDCDFIAQDCYLMADAMIRARNKENAGPTTG